MSTKVLLYIEIKLFHKGFFELCSKQALLLFAFLSFFSFNSNAQKIFFQDCFRGNVVVVGVNSLGVTNIVLPNQSSSLIRKAFLVSGSHTDNLLPNKNYYQNIIINNDTFKLDNTTRQTPWFSAPHLNQGGYVHTIDVSKVVTTNAFQIEVLPMSSVFPPGEITTPRFYGMSLVVIYENPAKLSMCFNIWLNDLPVVNTNQFTYLKIMPINSSQDVGLSFSLAGILGCQQNLLDGSYVSVNGNNIGLLCGPDECYSPMGTTGAIIGQFYYENGTLNGICDDTPDSLMSGNDVLANIKSYISYGDTSFQATLTYQRPNASLYQASSNPCWATFLAYTSPCDTFSVTHTPDTTVCQGAQLPLFVTGGQAYEWTPQVGLSCYDCPNPVFTADSTMHYSIRIWNNDSCSKVLPLHIVVEEALPHFHFDISPSECGDSTGSITVTPALSGFSYINQSTQDTNTTGIFSGLESGFYPISIVNNSACSFDTVVFIPETLSVHADFIASPNAGISPLPVAFTNTSSHANSYQWICENQTSNQENLSYTFQQDGIYPVMLIAYGNSILCADTAYDTIYVYLPIEVEIPNIFTPNSDQNNDQWGIKINVPAEVDLQIFNRWGEIIVNRKEEVLSPGFVPLWDGGEHVGGVYYYVLRLKTDFEKKEFKGNLTLVR